jgi:hypothetical protein
MDKINSLEQLPKISECLFWYAEARKITTPLHNQIKARRNYYDGKHYPAEHKPGEERYNDPTFTNVVDLAVGIILGNDMEWKARGWGVDKSTQRESSKIEKFLSGVLQINSEQKERHLIYEVIRNFVRDGCSVLYTVWEPEAHMRRVTVRVPNPDMSGTALTEEKEAFEELPLKVDVVDPLEVVMVPGGKRRWTHVFRTQKMTAYEVEMRYGIVPEKYKHLNMMEKFGAKGDFIDYWRYATVKLPQEDGTHKTQQVVEHAIIFEGEFVLPLQVAKGYKDIPYDIGFFKPVDEKNSKNWTQSLIDPMESTVLFLEKMINRRARQITVFSSLPLVIQSNRPDVEVDAIFQKIQIRQDEKISFPTWQGNPPDFERQLDFLRSRLQQSGFSDVMFGSGPNQISGYAINQLGDQNRIRLTQPIQHLQLLWQRWAKKSLCLTETFANGAVVRIWGKMQGKDFAEQIFPEGLKDFNIRCVIKPVFPNERSRNHAMSTQVQNVLPMTHIMQEYLDIEQPDEMWDMKLQEMMDAHPMMQQFALMRELAKLAIDGDEAEAMAAQMVLRSLSQGPGQGAGGGRPAMGRKAEQPLGLASSTGQETPQAQGGEPPGTSMLEQIQDMAQGNKMM